ncbi:MAG: NAD(P)H-quinone oxidoreductase [Pseudomonadota bacterium]
MTHQPQIMTAMALINDTYVAENRAMPVPGPGQVLIAVKAAGLNRADLLQRRGLYPPPAGASDILGLEVSGTIQACGPDCGRWGVGDAVCALLPGGGYATHALAHISCVLPKPAPYSWEEAAGLPEALYTVWNNVFVRGKLQAGNTFLITGGSSGIGTLAIQMAKHIAEAQVIALCRADKAAQVAALGADIIRDYRDAGCYQDLPMVDVVLDMAGGPAIQQHIALMNADARHINIAYMGGKMAEFDIAMVMRKRLTLTGSTLRGRPTHEVQDLRDGIMTHVWPHIEAGRITPIVHQVFDLQNCNAAQNAMANGDHVGKIVLKIP